MAMHHSWGVQAAFSLGMMGLVFWAIRRMIDKLEQKVKDNQKSNIEQFQKIGDEINGLKEFSLTGKTHQLICQKTQAETKLHISKTAQQNREILFEAIKENRELVMDALREMKEQMVRDKIR